MIDFDTILKIRTETLTLNNKIGLNVDI